MMENKTTGYTSKRHGFATKRYCQTLDLKDDSKLIETYVERHSQTQHWTVIREGLRLVGILEMEIYLLGNRLFMIVETPLDFDWDKAFTQLATMPQQKEWEDYMSVFQNAKQEAASNEKWQKMERIFNIYE
ncbi:MAG: hypothetical protein RL662_1345 [Bacteroidota bacterium]|jgi:L-rhamnose mutarotase